MTERRSPSSLIVAAALVCSYADCADTPIPADYPAAALELADELAPELSVSLASCNVERARAIHEKVLAFIYKEWNWNANYQQLKPFRVCYRMLNDIAATTQLVTNKYSSPSPYGLAGPFDADYAACRKLADPSYDFKGIAISARWPARFGPDPNGRTCNDRTRSPSQSAAALSQTARTERASRQRRINVD